VRDLKALLPDPDLGYRGSRGSLWFLVGLLALVTARSLVHVFAADGGAQSIAGMSVDGPDGQNIVGLFAQWGLEQLLLAVVGWVVVLRYRFLVPLGLLLQLADWGLRWGVGAWKPLVIDGTPPGEIGNYIFVPLVAVALWFSLPRVVGPGRADR
jgi:uncharacterized membrane protein